MPEQTNKELSKTQVEFQNLHAAIDLLEESVYSLRGKLAPVLPEDFEIAIDESFYSTDGTSALALSIARVTKRVSDIVNVVELINGRIEI